jgi:hypothetical protein
MSSKPQKEKITVELRRDLWYHRFGKATGEVECVVCEKNKITQLDHVVGHIVAASKGGSTEIANLIPICYPCNKAMNTIDMRIYTKDRYKRDLAIPHFVDGRIHSIPAVLEKNAPPVSMPIKDNRITEFIMDNFIRVADYNCSRKKFIDHIKSSFYGIKDISIDDVYKRFNEHFNISLTTPSPGIKGIAIKSVYAEEMEAKAMKEKEQTDAIVSFCNKTFTKNPPVSEYEDESSIYWYIIRKEIYGWNRKPDNVQLNCSKVFEYIKQEFHNPRNDNKSVYGIGWKDESTTDI